MYRGLDYDNFGIGSPIDPFGNAQAMGIQPDAMPGGGDAGLSNNGQLGGMDQDSDATNFLVSWMLEAAGKNAR